MRSRDAPNTPPSGAGGGKSGWRRGSTGGGASTAFRPFSVTDAAAGFLFGSRSHSRFYEKLDEIRRQNDADDDGGTTGRAGRRRRQGSSPIRRGSGNESNNSNRRRFRSLSRPRRNSNGENQATPPPQEEQHPKDDSARDRRSCHDRGRSRFRRSPSPSRRGDNDRAGRGRSKSRSGRRQDKDTSKASSFFRQSPERKKQQQRPTTNNSEKGKRPPRRSSEQQQQQRESASSTRHRESTRTEGSSSTSSGSDHNRGAASGKSTQTDVAQAFAFFGTTAQDAARDPEAVREHVKRTRRRLALDYHPDRNQNSAESVRQTQSLNQYYDLVCQQLDLYSSSPFEAPPPPQNGSRSTRRQQRSSSVPRRAKSDPVAPPHAGPSSGTGWQSSSWTPGNSNGTPRGPSGCGNNRGCDFEDKKDYDEATVPLQMQQIWREADRIEEQVRAWRMTTTTSGSKSRRHVQMMPETVQVSTAAGRDAAHSAWVEVSRREALLLARDNDENKKPRHALMECCSDPLAIAIRLGHVEAAHRMIRNRIKGLCSMWEGDFAVDNGAGSRQELMVRAQVNVMSRSLDPDGNTMLHYAVYFESPESVAMLKHCCGRSPSGNSPLVSLWDQLLVQENRRGQLPLDFALVRNKVGQDISRQTDESRRNTEAVRRVERDDQTKVDLNFCAICGLLLERAERPTMFWGFVHVFLSFELGRSVFGCSWPSCLAAVCAYWFVDYQNKDKIAKQRQQQARSAFLSSMGPLSGERRQGQSAVAPRGKPEQTLFVMYMVLCISYRMLVAMAGPDASWRHVAALITLQFVLCCLFRAVWRFTCSIVANTIDWSTYVVHCIDRVFCVGTTAKCLSCALMMGPKSRVKEDVIRQHDKDRWDCRCDRCRERAENCLYLVAFSGVIVMLQRAWPIFVSTVETKCKAWIN